MKALKEFDYNLWTTEENGVKHYWIGVKATGETTEVDLAVMRLLRNEEKKMRRELEEREQIGTVLSLDRYDSELCSEQWLADTYSVVDDVHTSVMEAGFIRTLSPMQREVYVCCVKRGKKESDLAAEKGISKQTVTNALRKIREKAKKYFG